MEANTYESHVHSGIAHVKSCITCTQKCSNNYFTCASTISILWNNKHMVIVAVALIIVQGYFIRGGEAKFNVEAYFVHLFISQDPIII